MRKYRPLKNNSTLTSLTHAASAPPSAAPPVPRLGRRRRRHSATDSHSMAPIALGDNSECTLYSYENLTLRRRHVLHVLDADGSGDGCGVGWGVVGARRRCRGERVVDQGVQL